MCHMTTVQIAEQVVRDVLLLRGPDATGSGSFRMTTEVMSDGRAALAKRFALFVPPGAGMDDVPRIAAGIVPLLTTAVLRPYAD